MLSDHALPASFRLESIELHEGPFLATAARSGACLVFPIDALLTMGSSHGHEQGLSWIGSHACLDSQAISGTTMQAYVRVPGKAYQIDWPPAQVNSALYADCLWHAASATQGLIRQMAQWSFCVQHHTREQSLSSWLLHGLAQRPDSALSIHLAAIPQFLRPELAQSQDHADEMQALSGYGLAQDRLQIFSRQQLAHQACSCHQTLKAQSVKA